MLVYLQPYQCKVHEILAKKHVRCIVLLASKNASKYITFIASVNDAALQSITIRNIQLLFN